MELIVSTLTILVMASLCISGRKYYNKLPGIIVSLGILGTVTGAVIGVSEDYIADIAGNASALASDLKTVFAPVIVGLFIAVILKLTQVFSKNSNAVDRDSATLSDLAGLLSEISQTQKVFYNESNNKLRLIYQSLNSTEENTLSSNILSLRQSITEKLDDLIISFTHVTTQMTESHSQLLVESRKDLIDSFNSNMKKHLDSNFKHFNEGIDKLLQWHDKYRDQVEKMVMELYASVVIIKECERSLSASSKESESYQKTVDSLKTLIADMHRDTELINSQIEFVDAFVNKIKNSIPHRPSLRQL